jgi:hypothetical protein
MARQESDADRDLAEAATKLLAEHGRPDLAVTDTQVRDWRVRAALPGTSRSFPGRAHGGGSRSTYPPGTERVAEGLALALDRTRDGGPLRFERAVLGAESHGIEVEWPAVRIAYRRVIDHFIREAQRERSPRSRRRRAPSAPRDPMARQIALELLSREDDGADHAPQLVDYTAESMADETFGEPVLAERTIGSALLPELNGLFRRLTLAALKRAALRSNPEDVRRSVGWARAFADLGTEVLRTMPLARDLGGERGVVRQLFAFVGQKLANDLLVALAGPMLLIAAPTPELRRRVDRLACAARAETPKLTAKAREYLIVSPAGDAYFSYLIGKPDAPVREGKT